MRATIKMCLLLALTGCVEITITSPEDVESTETEVALAADIKVNGSDGPVTIRRGETFNYTWKSSGATACFFASPYDISGIVLSGESSLSPGHPWYPLSGQPSTFTFTCTDGYNTVSDYVSVRLP